MELAGCGLGAPGTGVERIYHAVGYASVLWKPEDLLQVVTCAMLAVAGGNDDNCRREDQHESKAYWTSC